MMPYQTLIDVHTLAQKLDDPRWLVVDCRFDLNDAGAGQRAYHSAHIPGALYAHLEDDLSGPPLTNHGRHPLPTPEALIDLFSHMGVTAGAHVVAYDDRGGAIAARLWWLLRYMGHEKVAVLDGGWSAWLAAGLPTASGSEEGKAATFVGQPRPQRLVLLDDVPAVARLVDSRAPERYRGEDEPFDPVAGHIPGAINYFYGNNLDESQHFLPPEAVRAQLLEVLQDTPPEEAVFYCGSGVTACHNLLAMAHAGLPEARLYAGSWSEWCASPTRPIAPDPKAPGGSQT